MHHMHMKHPQPDMHHMHPAHEREGDPASVAPAVPIRSFRLRQASGVLPDARRPASPGVRRAAFVPEAVNKNMFQV